jgi:beta-lactamase regulating signal transducer with metallopeptidase domain
MVIGWLKPAILLPVGCMAGMSLLQIEAILAHELAHIRRHDYLVSLFQSVVETLLFYHPAVWWVSSQIRREREHCCDDLAVAVSGLFQASVIRYDRDCASRLGGVEPLRF